MRFNGGRPSVGLFAYAHAGRVDISFRNEQKKNACKGQAFDKKRRGVAESATRTRQAEELTRLTRRVAIRGPLPSDLPTGW